LKKSSGARGEYEHQLQQLVRWQGGPRMEEETRAVRDNMANEFLLHEIPYYSEDKRVAKLLPLESEKRNSLDWWGEKLLQKGVAAQDIEFLVQVLNPDARERWTAADIAKSGYLEV
jgi:hypothetical protein